MSTTCRGTACAALLSVCLHLAAGAQDVPNIASLAFEGLEGVDRGLVEEAIRLVPGEPAHAFQVTQTVRNLYALGLFDQIEVDVAPAAGNQADVTVRFVERPKVTQVVFEGNKEFSVEDLREHPGAQPGGVLRRSGLFQLRRSIEASYQDEGYADAVVLTDAAPDAAGEGVVVRVRIEEGERGKIRRIQFDGNESFPPEKLRGAMKVKPAGFLRKGRFQREKLEEDAGRIEDFYQDHGFRDARVVLEEPTFSPDGKDLTVKYTVREGPRYYFGAPDYEGISVLDPLLVQENQLFREGDAYSESKVQETLANLYNLYTERGYLVDLRIDPVSTVRGDTVAVTYMVSEGSPSHVGNIKIVGNTRTKERVIRRELKLFPGDLLRRSLLLRSQRDIFATGYFEDVQVEFDPAATEEEVDVTFRVAEHSSATANGGVGYSSQVGLTGFVKFGHNNLFGNGQSLMVEIERGSRREYYDLSFTEPWMFGRPISAGIDLYNTESYREVYTTQGYDASYWHKVRGGGVRVGVPWMFKFPDYTRLTVGYSYSETRYRNFEDVPDDTAELLLEGDGSRSRVFVSLYRNSTDNPFHPTLGTRTTVRHEFNGGLLGGDMDYYRFTIDHRQYFIPFWKPVMMLRWRLGALGPYSKGDRMPPAERFRLGGITGFDLLRGYDDYYIVPEENVYMSSSGSTVRFPGGKVMLALTAEAQFPVVDPVHGVLFMDAGDTWNSGYDISLSGLNLGVGAGITMEIPMLGPIGFYYGYGTGTKRWRTHFAFGPQL